MFLYGLQTTDFLSSRAKTLMTAGGADDIILLYDFFRRLDLMRLEDL